MKTNNDFVEEKISPGTADLSLAALQEAATARNQYMTGNVRMAREIRALGLLKSYKAGLVSRSAMREAYTTSDFIASLGSIMQTRVVDALKEYPAEYAKWTYPVELNDFRPTRLAELVGGYDPYEVQPEGADTPIGKLGSNDTLITAKKYSLQYPYTLETMLNDTTTGFLSKLPQRIAWGGRRRMEMMAEGAILAPTASGVNTDVFNTANGNLINQPLTVDGLTEAMKVLATQTDATGAPIYNQARTLIVPRGLEMQAARIIGAREFEFKTEDATIIGTAGFGGLQIASMPYAEQITGMSATDDIPWGIVADQYTGNPGVVFGSVTGFSDPQVFVKVPDSQYVSGGLAPASFENNTISFKGMVAGAAQVYYPQSIVMSASYGT